MIKQQQIDAEECEQMQEQGKDKDYMGCSCNICIAQISDMNNVNDEIRHFKNHLLENITIIAEDIINDFDSPSEIYSTNKIINKVIDVVNVTK